MLPSLGTYIVQTHTHARVCLAHVAQRLLGQAEKLCPYVEHALL